MSASQLNLYNRALVEYLGERSLAALTDNVESRRVLDEIWNSGAVIDRMLSEGLWKFAIRTSQFVYDPAISPLFGYQRAFQQPTDYIRVAKICADEYFEVPLTRYTHEAGVFYSDVDYVYMSYVSNDVNYGKNMTLWPEKFQDFFACYLATKACMRITQNAQKLIELQGPDGKKGVLRAKKTDALSMDAMEAPTTFLPKGAWTTARGGYGTTRRDGGSRFNLIG